MKYVFIISAALLVLFIAGCSKEFSGPTASLSPPERKQTDTLVPIQPPTQPVDSIIFENLTWIFPWYNAIEISRFSDLLSGGTTFKVYIRRHDNATWIEVPLLKIDNSIADEYEYFIEKRPDGAGMYNYGSLYIFYYGSDVSDRPSVTIKF